MEGLGEVIKELVRLKREIKGLNAQLKERKALYAKHQEAASKAMVQAGLQNTRTADGATVYLATKLYCSKRGEVSQQDAVAALREAGMEELVEASTTGLKAVVREALEELPPDAEPEEALPEPLRGLFNIHREQLAEVQGA